jgi:hypothetical protein
MMHFKKIFFTVLFLSSIQLVFAWGVTGHRVVAEIAQRHLTQKSLAAISQIIGSEKLAYWSNWPDFIKSDTTHQWDSTSKWHYVDLPGNTPKPAFETELKALDGANLYSQVLKLSTVLKDKTKPLSERRDALAFIIHLIGDLHQPLHVGRDEDQGGNKITVYWFDKKTNLHSVWDASLVDFQQYSYTEYADLLSLRYKNQMEKVKKTKILDWFYESHVLSDKIYALSPNEAKLSYQYNYIFQDDLNLQLYKGGIRLAKILNEIFK